MTPERWQRVRGVFHGAWPLPAADRVPFVEAACDGDAALKEEVLSLLRADHRDSFLERPAAVDADLPSAPGAAPDGDPAPARIGAYSIERLIARGGMGAVYLAHRDNDFHRRAALKVIRRGLDSDAIVRRFRTERQILANFDHPGIARLLDGGAAESGLPYLVMEYIEGESIVQYCASRDLGVRARLGLFREVCAAVQYAHQNLVVHRDLKPSNILVTPSGQPKLLDFGIAKILGPDLADGTADLTTISMRVLTPEYASPEQTRGGAITTASDVYALGVLLYELLTDRRPYKLTAKTPEAIERAIREQEPERPSSAADPARRGELDADLDAIVLKALEKEPARRYASADALSDDLGRYLAHLPVHARRASGAHRAARFVRRHRFGVALASSVALSLGGGVVATIWQAQAAQAARDRAEAERVRAQRGFEDSRRLALSLVFELHDAIWNLEGALGARQLLITRAVDYLEKLTDQAGEEPALRLEAARVYGRLGGLQGDAYWAANLGQFRPAVESYRRGRALLDRPDVWPEALRVDRAAVQTDLLTSEARTLGSLGDVTGGLEAVRGAQRWHDTYVRELEARQPGVRAPRDGLPQLYLDEADLALRAGDLTANLTALERMRGAIERWDDPAINPLGKGTYFARVGHAQHVLAVSMGSRLGDARAARALLVAALASQQRAYELRKRAWDGERSSQPLRSLTAQCLLFMGNAAFGLARDSDGRRWVDEGIRLAGSGGVAAWGHQWLGRRLVARGRGREALTPLAAAHDIEAAGSSEEHPSSRLAAIHQDTADAYWLAGDRAASERSARTALRLFEQLTRASPSYGEHAENLAFVVTHLASRLVVAGRSDDARTETARVLALLKAQADAPAAAPSRLIEYAWLRLTAQPIDLRDARLALEYAQRAAALPGGRHPDGLAVLAVAQHATGAVDEAVVTAREIYDLVPAMRAGRDDASLRLDIRRNLATHPLLPPVQPLWF